MPYKKTLILSLISAALCLAFVFSSFIPASPSTCITDAGPSPEEIALEAMVKSFKLYHSFFNDFDYQQGYQLSRHGITREAAIEYLSLGFETELATAIIDEYTWIIPERGCLAIKPCDGLPILHEGDLPPLTCNRINDRNIVFSEEFTGCYSPNDRYVYRVEMKYHGNRWKISALSLDKQ